MEGGEKLMSAIRHQINPGIKTNGEGRRIAFRVFRRMLLSLLKGLQPVLPQRVYMRHWIRLMKAFGMRIVGEPIYVSPSCWFDGTDYSLITLGDKVVISSHVSILTHDFSLARAIEALHGQQAHEYAFVRPVSIGDNSFVGRSALLLPGARIGRNCIIGAGSVVRGEIPDDSIVIGNPGRIVGKTSEWGARKIRELGLELEMRSGDRKALQQVSGGCDG